MQNNKKKDIKLIINQSQEIAKNRRIFNDKNIIIKETSKYVVKNGESIKKLCFIEEQNFREFTLIYN